MKKVKQIVSMILLLCFLCGSMVYAETDGTEVLEANTNSRSLQRTTYTTFDSGQWVDATQMTRLSDAWNGYFYIPGAISWGFCAQNTIPGWYNNQVKGGYIVEWNDATVRKILYYAPGSPGYTGTNTAYDMDNATYATGYMNGDSNNNTRAQAYIASLANLTDPIVYGYKAYYMYNSETAYQDIAFLGLAPQGALEIVKYSSDSNLTNGDVNYSLAGAVYGVYAADGDYSAPEYTITLSEWSDGWSGLPQGVKYGWGKIEGLPPGDYWVKEITAPPGFELDPNWYPSYSTAITVSSNATVRVSVYDEPQKGSLEIYKYSSNPELTNNNENYSLAGAVYGVYKADGDYSSPEYTITTSAWYDGSGKEAAGVEYGWGIVRDIPIGYYWIKELTPPKGFALDENWYPSYTQAIYVGNRATATIEVEDPPQYEEPVSYRFVVQKENEEGTKLEGAEFGLYLEEACMNEFASGITDADGILGFDGLTVGTKYYLKEKEAPAGYRVQVDEEGNPIVTEIYTASVPESDELKLVVVNEMGYRLPETGSSITFILLLIAMSIFIIGIYLDNNYQNSQKRSRNMRKGIFKKLFTIAFTVMLFTVSLAGKPVNAATMNAENGVVDFQRGDAKITITGNAGQSLAGKKFQIYRLFDAENSSGLESVNYTFNPDYKSVLQTIVGGNIRKDAQAVTEYEVIDYIQSLNQNEVEGAQAEQIKEGSYSEFRYFVEALRNEIVKAGIEGDVVEVSSTSIYNSVAIEGLEYGYYIIDEVTDVSASHQATSLCMVSTANPNAAIRIKSDYPTVMKKIQEDDHQDTIGNAGWNDIGDFEIGQDVPYKYESTIPNINGYNTYYWAWHDNMDEALTLQNDTIQIVLSGTVNDTDKNYTLLETEFNLITNSEDTTFTIEIENIKEIIDREFDNRDANQENAYGQKITVLYKATLNEKAAEDLGRPGFENDVRVEFSNNPNQDCESQTGFTPWDTVVCFTYQINGLKINNYGTPLEGAVFRLYTDEACENEVYVKEISDGFQVVHQDTVETLDVDENEGMKSDSNGEFQIYGLDSGTYYLKEVSAPTGYRPLLDPIEIQISPTFTSERNSYVKGDGAGEEIMELAAVAKIKTFTDGAYDEKEIALEVNQEEGSMNLSIVNEAGKKLPITGSQMMLVLSVAGVALMLVAMRKSWKRHE